MLPLPVRVQQNRNRNRSQGRIPAPRARSGMYERAVGRVKDEFRRDCLPVVALVMVVGMVVAVVVVVGILPRNMGYLR